MKNFFLLILVLFSSVASADTLDPYFGTWKTYGMEFLKIEPAGESLEILSPKKPAAGFSLEYRNSRFEEGVLKFERVSTRKVPVAGKPDSEVSYCDIKLLDNGKLHMRMAATSDMEDAHDIILTNPEKRGPPAALPPGMMEFILFLNANQANNGSASYKADPENKTLKYFDAEGRLMEESHIDTDNAIVTKKYDQSGQVVSETKITPEDIMDQMDLGGVR